MEIQFTALMPLYAGSPFEGLVHSVRSVIEQSLPPNELLIIQDGPLSNEVINFLDQTIFPFPVRRIKLNQNSGIGVALQVGIEEAKYPWIARIDADDISSVQRFEYSVKVLQEKPELAILGTWSAEVEDIDTNSRLYFIREVPASFKGIKRHGRFRTPFNHMTTFFLKEAALAAGGYRNYYYYEDWDLWLRMFQLGYKGENIPKVLVLVQQNYSRRSGWKSIQGDFKALTGFYKAGHHSFWMLLLNLITRSMARLIPPYTKYIYRNLLRKTVREMPRELGNLRV